MKYLKIVQMALFVIGVYCANINSMDSFDGDIFFHFFENSPENFDKEGLSWSNMFSSAQQMQQQPFNQQQLVQPQISSVQPAVMVLPSKPAPLVPRRAIATGPTKKGVGKMKFVKVASAGCGCRGMARIPNKLIIPGLVSMDSANGFFPDKYIKDHNGYYLYPSPTKAFFDQTIVPVAAKIRKYKEVFLRVLGDNMQIAGGKMVNDEFKERYLAVTEAIQVLNVLKIKYANPGTGQDVAFIFEPDFYTFNETRPFDKHGLCAYPKKTSDDSNLCIKTYKKGFDESYNHNRPIIEQLSTREMLKDYDEMIRAIREMTIYLLLSGNQARLDENKYANAKKICCL